MNTLEDMQREKIAELEAKCSSSFDTSVALDRELKETRDLMVRYREERDHYRQIVLGDFETAKAALESYRRAFGPLIVGAEPVQCFNCSNRIAECDKLRLENAELKAGLERLRDRAGNIGERLDEIVVIVGEVE